MSGSGEMFQNPRLFVQLIWTKNIFSYKGKWNTSQLHEHEAVEYAAGPKTLTFNWWQCYFNEFVPELFSLDIIWYPPTPTPPPPVFLLTFLYLFDSNDHHGSSFLPQRGWFCLWCYSATSGRPTTFSPSNKGHKSLCRRTEKTVAVSTFVDSNWSSALWSLVPLLRSCLHCQISALFYCFASFDFSGRSFLLVWTKRFPILLLSNKRKTKWQGSVVGKNS